MQTCLDKNSFLWSWAVISVLGGWKEKWTREKQEALLRKEKLSLKNKTISKLCSTENMVP